MISESLRKEVEDEAYKRGNPESLRVKDFCDGAAYVMGQAKGRCSEHPEFCIWYCCLNSASSDRETAIRRMENAEQKSHNLESRIKELEDEIRNLEGDKFLLKKYCESPQEENIDARQTLKSISNLNNEGPYQAILAPGMADDCLSRLEDKKEIV